MMKYFRRFQDLGLSGKQAKMYDKNMREHRMIEVKKEASEISHYIKEGDTVLEIAPGPGYLSIELSKLGKYNITGLDISEDILNIAKRNAMEAGVEINFQQGNASRMPFDDSIFNFIICILSFKNFKEPILTLNEMYRVLKPGGIALIKDLNKNAPAEVMKELVKNMGLTGINAFLASKIQSSGAYTKMEFEDFISLSKFKDYEIKESEIGFSIYLKK